MVGAPSAGGAGGLGGASSAAAAAMAKMQQHVQATQQAAATALAAVQGNVAGAGLVKMIVARVVLGQQQPGNGGMKRPDAAYDSVYGIGTVGAVVGQTGCASNAYCHVIFDNHQAYPEYVLTLKRA